jgi:hypothetical protein
MTNTDRRKRALLARQRQTARTWTPEETDAYHERMQALLEERRELRIAKQREIVRSIDYSDLEEDE